MALNTIVLENKGLQQEHFFHGESLELLEDPSGNLSIKTILLPQNQKKFFIGTIKIAGNYHFKSYYWAKFKVLNRSDVLHKWVVELYDFKIDFFEIYIPDGKGGYVQKTGGDRYAFFQREYLHKNFVFDINFLPKGSLQTFYMKIYSEDPIGIVGVVRTHHRFAQYATMEYYLLALFYGILISIGLYNFFLFISIKDKAYLFLASYILSFGIYSMCQDGTGFQFLWPYAPVINKYAQHFFLLVIMVSMLLYAKAFLLTTNRLPRLNQWLNFLILFRTGIFIAALLHRDQLLYKYISVYDFLTAFFIFIAGMYTFFYKKYKPAKLYIVAFAFLFTGLFITTLHSLRIVDVGGYLEAYAFNGGVVLQAFFLSVSIGNRINILINEKENLREKVSKDLESKVDERTKELQEKNRQLDALVYKASHDIKGPLKSIMGLANIASKDITDPAALEYFSHILKSSSRLDSILNDVLDLTKMQGATPINLVSINLEDFFNDLFSTFQDLPEAKGVRFDIVKNSEGPLCIQSDRKILFTIFQNIIENGVRYKDENKNEPFVTVQIIKGKDHIQFIFTDNGIGIPASFMGKIFEIFTKAVETSNGFGIGLHIVKLSVEKLQGTIAVESKIGQGTIFKITLPLIEISDSK